MRMLKTIVENTMGTKVSEFGTPIYIGMVESTPAANPRGMATIIIPCCAGVKEVPHSAMRTDGIRAISRTTAAPAPTKICEGAVGNIRPIRKKKKD